MNLKGRPQASDGSSAFGMNSATFDKLAGHSPLFSAMNRSMPCRTSSKRSRLVRSPVARRSREPTTHTKLSTRNTKKNGRILPRPSQRRSPPLPSQGKRTLTSVRARRFMVNRVLQVKRAFHGDTAQHGASIDQLVHLNHGHQDR